MSVGKYLNIGNHFESTKRGFVIRNIAIILILLAGISLFTSGCVSLGKDFSESNVSLIKIGQTTKNEIRKLFGSTWLSGIQDGELTWTYGNYDYSLFGKREAKDLVIQFDEKGVVTTYTFSTTDHND